MDFFKNFFFNPEANFDPLSLIGVLLTIIFSIYISRFETSVSFAKERHEKLFAPLFFTLEPKLYQKLNNEILESALKIIEEHKEMIDGKLLEIYHDCRLAPTNQAFISLCSYVDHAYDKSCRKVGLRPRSLSYKILHHQYKDWTTFGVYLVKMFIAMAIPTLFFTLLFLYVLLSIQALYHQMNDAGQFLFLAIFLCLLFLNSKFISHRL